MGDAAARVIGHGPDVVGRDAEQARIDTFLDALTQGARSLVIRGEPGIGKTTLWRQAAESARRAGYVVLVARASEEEMSLALGGLVDLFEDLEIDAAALLAESNPFTRGRAVLEAVRSCAESSPVVIAIDDVQWFDSASARAMRYALRRLDAEPVGLLATARPNAEQDDPLSATASLPPGRSETLDLGPLALEALRRVLGGTVETISRPLLKRIHEVSGGNPLYAIELARTIRTNDGSERASGTLQLPNSLQAAIDQRLETVPPEVTSLLEAVSALGTPSVKELRETLAESDVEDRLTVAEHDGLLVVEPSLHVRFAHPLIGSAVYGRMSPLARRSLHAALAEQSAEPDVRARHLALSTDEPDGEIAQLLELSAERAASRDAFDLAMEFAGHSLRLTPPEDPVAANRRALLEIENLARAGEMSGALALADDLVGSLPPGPLRAEAVLKRSYLEDGDLMANEALLLQALDDAGDDEALGGRLLDQLGWGRGFFGGDVQGGIAYSRQAVAIADRVGDPEIQMFASAALGLLESLAGAQRPENLERSVAIEAEIGKPNMFDSPRSMLGEHLLWTGDLTRARALFEAVYEDAQRAGDEAMRAYCLFDLALVECGAGALFTAETLGHEGMEAALDAEDTWGERLLLHPLALAQALLGRADEARATARRRLDESVKRGERPGIARARWVLGLLALSEGRTEAAATELVEAACLLAEMGYCNPGAVPALPDAIEALAGSGELEAAELLLDRLSDQASAADSAWGRAAAERSLGVLLHARGKTDDAVPQLERATASFDRMGFRPDAARAVLARGRALVRAGHRTLAADALADARDRFADMGATLWEARATEELERVAPGRAAGELTPTERRIAGLVAEGLKNREIGEALFVSVATVEGHLTRMYRKLDIRSRSELTRLVAEEALRHGELERG